MNYSVLRKPSKKKKKKLRLTLIGYPPIINNVVGENTRVLVSN